jgi:hypothetical protein
MSKWNFWKKSQMNGEAFIQEKMSDLQYAEGHWALCRLLDDYADYLLTNNNFLSTVEFINEKRSIAVYFLMQDGPYKYENLNPAQEFEKAIDLGIEKFLEYKKLDISN